MRSSKSRSRSKANRPRTLGNIINRVFDSSGPEGKVRGTPQQIIEKYQMLAGDAQRSNDRVAAENFSQHAEHYTRMLAEAQREMAAEQEQRQQSQQNNNGANRERQGDYRNDRSDYRPERGDQGEGDQPYTSGFGVVGEGDTSLVELPEANRQPQPRRDEQRREPRPEGQPRRNENRRDDRPRDENRRDDRPREERPRENRRELPRAEVSAEITPAPVVEAVTPRFESPAQLVAQVEQATSAPAKPRAPKPASSDEAAAKPARAPRVRKPKSDDAPEAAE